jgi:hypothetical protein
MRIRSQLFYLNTDPDPGSQINADPDPGQTLPSQKYEFLHEKYSLCRQYPVVNIHVYRTKAILKCCKSGLFVSFGKFPCFWIRIRIPIRIWIRIQESYGNMQTWINNTAF